jgi:hypothetical protein
VPLGASLSKIVARANAVPMVELTGLNRFSLNDSVGSKVPLPISGMSIVSTVCPGAKVSVPDWAT